MMSANDRYVRVLKADKKINRQKNCRLISLTKKTELFRSGSAYGTGIRTGTAVNAGIGIDSELRVALRNSRYGTSVGTSAAAYASV